MKKFNVRTYVSIGMLSGLAFVLMILKFPLPAFPTMLKVDFSDVPALIAMIIFGPLAGILVELFKNILDYFLSGSETGVPVGHIANFMAGILFILPVYYIYNKFKTKKGMTLGLVVGSVFMAIMMSVLNYFVFLPAYSFFLNLEAMSSEATRELIVKGILPFNVIKGFLISIVFMLMFVRLRSWIDKQTQYRGV
ncbi:ECF transporter S component [Bacillus spongiae]|uniref:Riboflavin transporter n=1 Tax=Bacillus spongiae TaxID=2683610 RepID=A0ABU8HCS4_9BACI